MVIIGYEVHCPRCHRNITDDVVFVKHELSTRCAKCGWAAPYPQEIHPRNMRVRNGRHECEGCGELADFGRTFGTSWQLRCNRCVLDDAVKFLRGHLRASSTAEVHSGGVAALVTGVPLAALTVYLALIDTAWFVLTGLFALPLLVTAANYLLRGEKVAARTAEDAERSKQLLDHLEDDRLSDVDKLALLGLVPGGLWSTGFPGDLLGHPQ